MAGDSKIEWTDATWNPTRGCTRCSPGCVHCYAERVAARFSGPGLPYAGLAKMTKDGARWTGKLRLVDDSLEAPLRWRKPRRIFVNSMSDLFHEALTIEQIAEVFAVMYLAPRHTFQVLTKRAARMCEVLTEPGFINLMGRAANRLCVARPKLAGIELRHPVLAPAPWVHLGVSVENQKYADLRVPELLATPAGLRFLSCEPLLGSIDLTRIAEEPPGLTFNALTWGPLRAHSIDWVIVGGESGPGARPFDVIWGRNIVEQCRHADVACFVKQLGALPMTGRGVHRERVKLKSKKGNNPAEWDSRLNVREFPRVPDAR